MAIIKVGKYKTIAYFIIIYKDERKEERLILEKERKEAGSQRTYHRNHRCVRQLQ